MLSLLMLCVCVCMSMFLCAWVVRAHSTAVGSRELFEVRSGQGGHTYLFNLGARGHINHRFGDVVRPMKRPMVLSSAGRRER